MAMVSERTPLTGGSPPMRATPRAFLAKLVGAVIIAAALATLAWTSRSSSSSSSPSSSDWFCGEAVVETDYIKLANKQDDYYFYWFVRSRSANANTNDPLVIWLNGGPGASSLEGLLTENGPCLVQQDLSTKRNAYAWNNHANVIWLEQPSGVGFSYFTADADKDATGEDVGANMVAFLDGFLDKHPEFVGRPLFLTGESYAGHYIPAAAYAIWQHMMVSTTSRINLQGIAIGNGDPNLPLQYKYSAAMATDNAYNASLLNASQIQKMNLDADKCSELLTSCKPYISGANGCGAAAEFCDSTQLTPFVGARRNVYDLRQPCTSAEDCSDTDGGVLQRFLTSETVTRVLASTVQGRQWNAQVRYVYEAYTSSGDWARSYMRELAALLDGGLRVLIYAGDADLVCNWIGNREWTLALEWTGKTGYNAAMDRDFVVSEEGTTLHGGVVRSFANLSFMRVFNAGHLVPKDQPHVAFEMIHRFLTQQPL